MEAYCIYQFADGRRLIARAHHLPGMEQAIYIQANEEVHITLQLTPQEMDYEPQNVPQIGIPVEIIAPILEQKPTLLDSLEALYDAKSGKINILRIHHK